MFNNCFVYVYFAAFKWVNYVVFFTVFFSGTYLFTAALFEICCKNMTKARSKSLLQQFILALFITKMKVEILHNTGKSNTKFYTCNKIVIDFDFGSSSESSFSAVCNRQFRAKISIISHQRTHQHILTPHNQRLRWSFSRLRDEPSSRWSLNRIIA